MNNRGKCPICSGQLKYSGLEMVCENGDYKTEIAKFEDRWKQFEEIMLNMTETLLEDLKSYNTVSNQSEK